MSDILALSKLEIPNNTGLSVRTRYAARILRDAVTQTYRRRHRLAADTSLPQWRLPDSDETSAWQGKVCIVGAGVAGLYFAMQLEKAGIDFDIVEASDRIGGRVNTHHFTEGDKIAHDYYDIGAMRFPHIRIMDPVFKLFKDLNVDIQPYYLSNPKTPNLFDNASVTSSEMGDILTKLSDAVEPFITLLEKDWDQGFKALMQADQYSTRQWLIQEQGLSFDEISRLETYSTGTGMFEQAFSETVLDHFDFDVAKDWSRVEGGTSSLIAAMERKLATTPQLNKRVTAIGLSLDRNKTEVTISGETFPRTYEAVINTTTMGCLGQMDLSRLELNSRQQTAIRALSYDKACKVAIKFKNAWWDGLGVSLGSGGSSWLDLPIRATVYPSWNDGTGSPAVLMCSYSWAQDAIRMGSLVPDGGGKNAVLLELVLNNLSRLFQNRITYDQLTHLVVDYHAFSFSHDPYSLGAYAKFSAGQFTNLYPAIRQPAANGRFFFVGECASEHHGWIVGAIQSAREALKTLGIRFDLKKLLHVLEQDSKTFEVVEPGHSEDTVLYHLVQHAVQEKLTIGRPTY